MRIFITLNADSLLGMYNRKGYTTQKSKAEKYIENIPHEIISDGNKIILLSDKFTNWETYYPISETDFILYHTSSDDNVKKEITKIFTYFVDGSHDLESSHDKVFQIIFDDKISNKVEKIIKILEFEKIAAQKSFKIATKKLTLAYLKSQNTEDSQPEINEVDEELKNVIDYLQKKENFEELIKEIENIIDKTDIDIKIKYFNKIDSEIHAALFV